LRLQRYIKYPIPTKSFHEKLLKISPRVACINPIANNLHGWKKFLSDCVIDALGHLRLTPHQSQNNPCRPVFVPIPTPKTPQEQGKRDQNTRFPPCVSHALPLNPMRRVSQPSPPPEREPTNALHKRAKTILPRTQVRSYRERSCDHTESVKAILPRAQRRSYKERPHHLDMGDGGVHSEHLRERLLSRVLPSLKGHYEEPWDTIHYRLV